MNDRGMLHFDLHAFNVLTDGDQVYVTDFGLALCSDFDLSSAERAFFETHRLYDRCCVERIFAEQLSRPSEPPILTTALEALADRNAPVAEILDTFIKRLMDQSKETPYPAEALEAACAGESSAR